MILGVMLRIGNVTDGDLEHPAVFWGSTLHSHSQPLMLRNIQTSFQKRRSGLSFLNLGDQKLDVTPQAKTLELRRSSPVSAMDDAS